MTRVACLTLASALCGCALTPPTDVTLLAESASLTVAKFDHKSDAVEIISVYEPAIGVAGTRQQPMRHSEVKWDAPVVRRIATPYKPAAVEPPKPVPVPAPVPVQKVERVERKVVFNDAMFAFNSAKINKQAQAALQEVVDASQDGKTLSIVGHADAIGSDSYNDKLSLSRAMAVRSHLITRGIKESQIALTEGHGKREPIADNTSEKGRAKNRRAEVVVTIIE